MEKYFIRDAVVEDIEQIIKISSADNRWLPEKYQEIIELNIPMIVICNRDNTTLVAFIVYIIFMDELRILNIGVDKFYTRNGLATRLLEITFSNAREQNCRYALLEVKTNNIDAINLYIKLGFVCLCIRKMYYEDRSNAYLMQLIL